MTYRVVIKDIDTDAITGILGNNISTVEEAGRMQEVSMNIIDRMYFYVSVEKE